VIGNPAEIERPQAWKTEYGRKLKDGKTRGLLPVFTIGLLVGEELRDLLYGEPVADNEPVADRDRIPGDPTRKKGKKWKRYSGLFVLLKQKRSLTQDQKAAVLLAAFTTFQCWIQPHVGTVVWTPGFIS
jgi:hypothetical protein